jgi:hypothetical protein
MTKVTTKSDSMQPATEMAVDLFDNWFDPTVLDLGRGPKRVSFAARFGGKRSTST